MNLGIALWTILIVALFGGVSALRFIGLSLLLALVLSWVIESNKKQKKKNK